METFPANKPIGRRAKRTELKSSKSGPKLQRSVPRASTNAENFYLIRQKDVKTPMVVTLLDGENIEGIIEWYDGNCIKIRRTDGLGIIVMKSFIGCLYKQDPAKSAGPK